MGKKISTCKCNEGQEKLVEELKKVIGDENAIYAVTNTLPG